jgi:hypothetical protein
MVLVSVAVVSFEMGSGARNLRAGLRIEQLR